MIWRARCYAAATRRFTDDGGRARSSRGVLQQRYMMLRAMLMRQPRFCRAMRLLLLMLMLLARRQTRRCARRYC